MERQSALSSPTETWGDLRNVDPILKRAHEFSWQSAGLVTETTDPHETAFVVAAFDKAWKRTNTERTIPPYEIVTNFRYLTDSQGSKLTLNGIIITIRPTDDTVTLQQLEKFKLEVSMDYGVVNRNRTSITKDSSFLDLSSTKND